MLINTGGRTAGGGGGGGGGSFSDGDGCDDDGVGVIVNGSVMQIAPTTSVRANKPRIFHTLTPTGFSTKALPASYVGKGVYPCGAMSKLHVCGKASI